MSSAFRIGTIAYSQAPQETYVPGSNNNRLNPVGKGLSLDATVSLSLNFSGALSGGVATFDLPISFRYANYEMYDDWVQNASNTLPPGAGGVITLGGGSGVPRNIPIIKPGESAPLGYFNIAGFNGPGGSEYLRNVTGTAPVKTVFGTTDVPFYSSIGDIAQLPFGQLATGYGIKKDVYGYVTPTPRIPEHIIAITHGWQPVDNWNSEGLHLEGPTLAILDKLGISPDSRVGDTFYSDDGSIAVIAYNWGGAVTPARDTVFAANGFPVSLSTPESLQQIFTPDGISWNNLNALRHGAAQHAANYQKAYDNSVLEGRKLADRLDAFVSDGRAINSSYDPTIHLVGHSLGTIVSAQAVSQLQTYGHFVDRVTLLDTPRRSSAAADRSEFKLQRLGFDDDSRAKLVAYDAAWLLWNSMPTNAVGSVDNLYAEYSTPPRELAGLIESVLSFSSLTSDTVPTGFYDRIRPYWESVVNGGPQFGQPIGGSLPCLSGCYGMEVPGTNHQTIQSEAFPDFVRNGVFNERQFTWHTPAFGEDPNIGTWNSSALVDWYLELVKMIPADTVKAELTNILILDGLTAASGQSFLIDNIQRKAGQISVQDSGGVRMIAQSPAAIGFSINTDNLLAIQLNLTMSDDADGIIELLLNNEAVVSVDADKGLTKSIYASLLDFIGWQDMEIIYRTDVAGSWVEIEGLQVVQIVTVPEPSSSALFGAILAIFRLQSRRKYAPRAQCC